MVRQPPLQRLFSGLHAAQGTMVALSVTVAAELLLAPTRDPSERWIIAIGSMVAVFLAAYSLYRFALVALDSFCPRLRDGVLIALLSIGSLFLLRLMIFLAGSIAAHPDTVSVLGHVAPDMFLFAVPIAAAPFVLRSVLGLPHALISGLIVAVAATVYLPSPRLLVVQIIVATVAAALSLTHVRRRSAYLRGGVVVALMSFGVAIASLFVSGSPVSSELLVAGISALVGGAIAAVLASALTPIVEHFGGYVTDLRLIELATIDHPLLKELSVQAPGTWNHSMVMGMMCEGAAEAIGANPVLARVGAYFHDVGKIKKPLYFVENQLGSENRHDKLSPSMSALIIRAHVKDGIDLARKHGLPEQLVDLISQHHGTNLIEYFYDRAIEEAKERGSDDVDATLYQYPGPKPQTPEAGILMLADGIEAAARSMSEPDPDRIQGMVQKMINKAFSSGQLDESQLTLRDLHLIARSFTRVLSGIHHRRIAYAEPAEKINEESADVPEGLDDRGSLKRRPTSGGIEGGETSPPENLKRLGI